MIPTSTLDAPVLVRLGRWLPIAVAVASACGCGSRGPLADFDAPDAQVIVVTDAAGIVGDAAPDAGADAPTSIVDEVLGCGLCVTQKCGDKVVSCIQDSDCNRVLQCVTQKCLLSGLDLQCITQCTTDPAAALKAFSIIQCVTGTCGDDCAGTFPPFGGLGN